MHFPSDITIFCILLRYFFGAAIFFIDMSDFKNAKKIEKWDVISLSYPSSSAIPLKMSG